MNHVSNHNCIIIVHFIAQRLRPLRHVQHSFATRLCYESDASRSAHLGLARLDMTDRPSGRFSGQITRAQQPGLRKPSQTPISSPGSEFNFGASEAGSFSPPTTLAPTSFRNCTDPLCIPNPSCV